MEIIKTTTENKKDIVRANNAVLGAQDVANMELTLLDAIIYDKADADGEIKRVTALKVRDEQSGEENFCTSISATVEQSIDTLLGLYTNEEIQKGVPIIIKSKESKGGRTFYYVDLA